MDPKRTGDRVSSRAGRRVRRQLAILAGSVLAGGTLVMVLTGGLRERLSLASAYVALTLLAITLSLGPMNVLRGRPNPVSFDRRRDFGIWSALFGLLHTAIGLTVHLQGRMLEYFLPTPDSPQFLGLRADPFGAANYAGLAAVLLLVLLTAISNDRALRSLGTHRWRALQRWSYPLLALTIMHGALYQVMETQRTALVVTFVAISASVVRAPGGPADARSFRTSIRLTAYRWAAAISTSRSRAVATSTTSSARKGAAPPSMAAR